jgi:hypothetical protein
VNVFDWLAKTPYALWVTESWGWPIALTVHAFGTAIVVGLTFIVGLRLFGLFRTIPFTLLNRFVAWIWFGVVCQVLSGLTLWMTKPGQYMADTMFDTKMALLVISVVVTLLLQSTIRREAPGWDVAGTASPRGVKFVAATCVLWAAVTIGGRLTAYLGTLYPS